MSLYRYCKRFLLQCFIVFSKRKARTKVDIKENISYSSQPNQSQRTPHRLLQMVLLHQVPSKVATTCSSAADGRCHRAILRVLSSIVYIIGLAISRLIGEGDNLVAINVLRIFFHLSLVHLIVYNDVQIS